MDPVIAASIITGAATVGAAFIALFAYRKHAQADQPAGSESGQALRDPSGQLDGAPSARDASVVFANVAIAPDAPYWYEYSEPLWWRWPFTRPTSKYFAQSDVVEGSDLPLDVTLLNNAGDAVVLTALGVEIVNVAHVPYGRPGVAGPVPEATKIERHGAYDLELPGIFGKFARDFDPDEDVTVEVNEVCSTPVADPIYLEAKAPFRYLLNLTNYDLVMPNHAVLRLWARTTAGEITSDEITVHYHHSHHVPPLEVN